MLTGLMMFLEKPKKKAKKSERKTLIKKLDVEFSKFIRERDKKCIVCGQEHIYCHHIFSRRNLSVRWHPDNAASLCVYHHRFLAHGDPMKFRRFLLDLKGEI